MQKKYFWNQYGLRVQYLKSREGRPLNWLFLPGGPGLGSESLLQLTESLNLPGTLWHIDLPGDGSNRSKNNIESFKKWPLALEEVVAAFENVILVCHSNGGMYALSLPSLEEKLMGFVLLDSAPDSSWQLCLEKMIKAHPLAEVEKLDEIYKKNPSDDILKKLTVAAAPYFFSDESLPKGKALLESLPFNYETCDWSEVHFDATYKAAWVP